MTLEESYHRPQKLYNKLTIDMFYGTIISSISPLGVSMKIIQETSLSKVYMVVHSQYMLSNIITTNITYSVNHQKHIETSVATSTTVEMKNIQAS